MASGTKPPPSPSQRHVGKAAAEPPDRVIERQLRKTRRQVKMIDLASAMMTLAAGVLVYLLALVLVDHWLIGLGWWGRFLALVALLGGIGWYVAAHVLPPLLGSINPVYAAQAIEESQPSLKNSLVNFLLLRDKGGAVHRIVFEAMRHRAASDLNRISVSTAVDRSGLIRVGYVLSAVLVLCGLYVILSPKDAFQTVSRVAAPWAEIARPARVQILDVLPGDDEVFQGQSIDVSADIRGIDIDDEVTLLFSSSDGQLVNQSIAMQVTERGLRHACSLPPDARGIQQDLAYRIQSGDAVTREYWLKVSPAPTILVERVEYTFPTYTRRPPRVVEGDGDVVALEGTKITVRARANYEIRSAWLEFDPPSQSSPEASIAANRLPMEYEETAAWRAFTLELQPDRRSQQHHSYQLAFQTKDGFSSEHQILHRIKVTPDLEPEIQVLTPTKDRIEVPEDGTQKIEIRAVDPDFGLSRVGLRAVAGGSDLIDEPLLENSQEDRTGQVVVEYTFRPSDLGLTDGDQVVYWAVAEDNRTAPLSDLPEPNVQRTRNYHILITPARNRKAEPSSPDEKSEPREQENQDESATGENQEGASGQGGTAGAEGAAGAESEDTESGGGEQGMSGQSGESQSPSSESDATGQGGESGGDTEQKQNASDESGDGQSSQKGAPSEGTNPETGDGSGTESRQEPLHDGEVFERALERMKQQQEQTSGGSQNDNTAQESSESPADDERPSDGAPGERNQDGQTAESETEPEGSGSPQEGGSDGQMQQPPSKAAESGTGGQEKESPSNAATPAGTKPPQTPREKPNESGETEAGQESQTGASEPGSGRDGDSNEEDGSNSQATRDRPKQAKPDKRPESTDGPSPANQSEKQSDSADEFSGNQSGGGEQGPGQNAAQPGQDNAASQSPADEGTASAPETGTGDASDMPGESQSAEKPTGASGNQQGPGSASQDDPNGNESSAGNQKPPPREGMDQQRPPPGSEQAPGSSPGNSSGPVTGGGLPSDGDPAESAVTEEVADGDEAQLDYARRATNMVLEYLQDQQDDPDQELLEEIGWSPEEMRMFLDRWMRLKEAADRDKTAEFELDETLRSLGLRPPRDRIRQNRVNDDTIRGMSESGSSSSVPERFRDQTNAFKKGAARRDR